MSFNDLPSYLDFLLKECSKLVSASDVHSILKSLYKTTKICPVRILILDVLTEEEAEMVHSILKSFLLVVLDDNISADELLLCGTCIVMFIASLFSPEFASSYLVYMICHLDEKFSGENLISDSSEDFKDKVIGAAKLFLFNRKSCTAQDFKLCENYFFNADSHADLKILSFYQVALLNGIVSCQIHELYCFPLKFAEEKPFLIFIFDAVYQSCLNPSIHQYHAFIILLNWMKVCENCFHRFKKTRSAFFTTNDKIVQNLLNLLESNWQSPVKGINGFIKELYKRIIKLNQIECKNLDVNDVPLCLYLLEKAMILSWQVKGKYFMLSAVLQHVDYQKFFQDNPDSPTKIIFNLKANYISSSVAEVYKVIVTNMKSYNSDEQFSFEWCRWWRNPILMCLCTGDKLLIQNTINNVLSWTIKKFPKFYEVMMETEILSGNDSVKLLLLRVAKENCPLALDDKELSLIKKNLYHGDIQIRSEILSILCSSPKKSEAVKQIEIEYVKIYIHQNLNIDSAPFHQHLLSQLNILLIRVRDSLAQEYRSKSQCDLSQLEFVDWLTYTAIQNTFPGACFQRRRLCLQLLNVIYDVFIESPKGFRRKENPSKSVEQVIKWAQKNNLWLFFSNDMLTYILPCITDFADEIRFLCANLLRAYSTWPEIDKCQDVNVAAVTKYALMLCNHPDYRNNDGGAHICDLIFHRLCLQSTEKKSPKALEFLNYLISVTKLQLETAKEDFLFVAVSQPIHGMLLALQYCITNSKHFFKSYEYECQTDDFFNILKDLMYMCFSIVDYMLNIMKGETENFFCPSFSDISKAMEKIVLSKKDTLCEIFKNSILEDSKSINGESSNYSTLCDLLLSCCWHSIKNSCFLLSELSSLLLALSIPSMDKKKFLQEIAEEFSSILISCRHRGVVEACCNALNNFCRNLEQDKSIFYDVTMGLIKRVLENLSDTSKVSVTRRSAGLPLLFQAVVSSEENNVNRQLLPYTIDNLLKLINDPFPSSDSISEKTDIPQAHAYHILKALVSEARLSQSILPYFDSIIPVCITGFSSNVWAIRNGALQLFGVILPRVCGQKKVRDDDSEHNLVSAFELFARCPSLKTYLLKELAKCVEFHHEKKLCSQLVPILSLLVKLMPERDDQRIFISDFIPLLYELLNTPVWKVRELVSIALSVLMLSSEVIVLLEKILHNLNSENLNVNLIHSMLLIVHNFMKRKHENILNNLTFIENNLKEIYILLQEKRCCPMLLATVIEMMLLIADVKDVAILECIEKTEIYDPLLVNGIGFSVFESKVVLAKLKIQTPYAVPLFVKNIKSKNKEIKIIFLQFLSQKLTSERSKESFYDSNSMKSWEDTFMCTMEFISSGEHPSVVIEALKFMTNLFTDVVVEEKIMHPHVCSIIKKLEQFLDVESGLSVAAHALTLWSICIRSVLENPAYPSLKECLEKWNLLFYSYCQPRSNDILRMQAATSLAILGPSLARYLSSHIQRGQNELIKIFLELCEGSLLLLQDEDEDIRNVACKFPSQISHDYGTDYVQFIIGIQIVFQHMTEVLCDEPFYILYLWNRLQNYPSTAKILLSYCNTKKRNLFEQEYVNVFAEPHQLLMLYHNKFKEVLTGLSKKNYELYLENISLFLHDSKAELEDVSSVLSSINIESPAEGFVYHHQAYLSLKKLRCQIDVLCKQINTISKSDELCSRTLELQEEWTKIEKLLPSDICWFLNVL